MFFYKSDNVKMYHLTINCLHYEISLLILYNHSSSHLIELILFKKLLSTTKNDSHLLCNLSLYSRAHLFLDQFSNYFKKAKIFFT